MRNHEVTTKQLLLDNKGEIAEPGWARSQIWDYKRSMIKAPKFRIKEWDYYLVMGQGFACAFTLSDDGYVGLQSVSLLTFGETPWEHTETVLDVFPMGKMHLPETSSDGNIVYDNGRLKMSFVKTEGERRIICEFENFFEGKPFKCDITMKQPDMDTMVIATPWDKKHAFYYNQKINCMRASGSAVFDGKTYEFDNVWIAPTMKGKYYGGGMKMAPDQDRFSDKLTVVVYHCRSKLKALISFPSIFKGEHVKKNDIVQSFTGNEVKVRFSRPCAAQIDGETVLNVTEYTAVLPR